MAKKKQPEKKEKLKTGLYTDTHCHLLPGVDDGVKDWEEALRCLDIARRERIAHICVTPHVRPDRYPKNTPEALRNVFQRFQVEAEARGIRASLGSEAYYTSDLMKSWGDGEILPMGESGRYLLVEFSNTILPHGIVEAFYNLRIAGVEPVLAHAERYPWAQRDIMRLAPLALTDIPFQVTTFSLSGAFGDDAKKAAFEMMERGWIYMASSDAHSDRVRAPLFREAVRAISRRYGIEAARRLFIENPRRLLAGEQLLPVICIPRRRFFIV
jgi:protein-tyrosine phosphatase